MAGFSFSEPVPFCLCFFSPFSFPTSRRRSFNLCSTFAPSGGSTASAASSGLPYTADIPRAVPSEARAPGCLIVLWKHPGTGHSNYPPSGGVLSPTGGQTPPTRSHRMRGVTTSLNPKPHGCIKHPPTECAMSVGTAVYIYIHLHTDICARPDII